MKNREGIKYLQEFLNIWNFSEEYLIYGTSNAANSLLKKLGDKLKIVGFLDSDNTKWGNQFAGYPVLSRSEWRERFGGHKIIVASGAYTEIREFLEKEGLREQLDFCDSRFLTGSYFAVQQNKVYLYRTDISITQYCNLQCEKCNMLSPYFKHPKHKELDQLKAEVDNYFQWVDNVQLFNILGGEPFVHPQVEEFTRYVCEQYGGKTERIVFFTNGLVKLQETMLALIKEYDIEIQVSDYRKGIPEVSERVDQFIQKLEQQGISYRRNIDNEWIDFGFPSYRNENMDEEQMSVFFDRCYSPFRGLSDGKLYYCHLNTSAVNAGLFEDNTNDYFDLKDFDSSRKQELVLFDLGYTELGYVTYCRRCKGCFAVNSDFIEVAKQLRRQDV